MAQKKTPLGDFILSLENARRLAAFNKDPQGVMERAGLTKQQQKLLQSGDVKRLRTALRRENPRAKIYVLREHTILLA